MLVRHSGLQVDRASFRVGDGKVVFTLICSADAMVTVYMNAMNKCKSLPCCTDSGIGGPQTIPLPHLVDDAIFSGQC